MNIPRLTREQAAIISAYTGFLAGPFEDMHEAVEKKLGRPVFTHEFAFNADEIKSAFKEDFISIVAVKQ